MIRPPESGAYAPAPDSPDSTPQLSGPDVTLKSGWKLPFFRVLPTVPTIPTVFYNTRRALAW